jgi:hypothetical protein
MSSKNVFDELLQEIQSGNVENIQDKILDLSDEQLDELLTKVQPYKSLGPAQSNKFVLGSVINMREEYLKKLLMTSLIGFTYQMNSEYTLSEDELENPPSKDDFMEEKPPAPLPDDFNFDAVYSQTLAQYAEDNLDTPLEGKSQKELEDLLSEDQLVEVHTINADIVNSLTKPVLRLNAVKYNEALEECVDKESTQHRAIINKFLNKLFKFDPNLHSEEGYQPVPTDDERKALTPEEAKDMPSNDTHCRFTKYYEVNYETLRTATKNMYNVKPDLEHAMIVYDVVDSKEDVDAFIRKYGSSSKLDILSYNLNQWTLMGPFKENRSRIDYYNKNNEIIKAMLDQQGKDASLGEELMKKRVKTQKQRAEKIFGKDDPKLKEYLQMTNSTIQVEELEDDKVKIVHEQVVDGQGKAIKMDEDGVPENSLEVPVININAKTGKSTMTRFFTEAEE